jgi:hypothetical protein
MRFNYFFKVILLFLLLLLGYQSNIYASNIVGFENGVLDLRGYSYEELQQIGISGKLEFYWGQMLTSNNFDTISNDSIDYIKVPSKWITHKINGKSLPAKGVATYRGIIILDSANYHLAFRIGSIGTAFRLFVDGKLIASAGKVGTEESEAVSGYKPGVYGFVSQKDTVELIFQVSNYNYEGGGLWNNYTKIGMYNSILKLWNYGVYFSIFLVAIMFIIAFYNLFFYYLNRKYIYTLFFSMFSIVIAMRTLVMDESFILEMFPGFSWICHIKVEYLTLTMGNITFVLFIYNFFNDKFLKKLVKIVVVASVLLSLVIISTKPIFFTKYLVVYQTFTLLSLFYTTVIMIRALLEKNIYAIIMFVSFIILMVSVVNDILFSNKIINTTYVSSFGFVIFIIFQVYIMAKHFSSLFNKSQDLTLELQAVNMNLESIVEKRTHKIEEQKTEILSKNRELNKQNKDIKLQKENIEKQNDVLLLQKHQITSSIEYASRIQGAVFNTTNNSEELELDNFIIFNPKDIVSGDFYWFKNISINNKKIKIIAVVDCTGHGVPGAFMSILGTLLLDKIVSDFTKSFKASDVLDKMRSEIKNILNKNKESVKSSVTDGMDMSLIIIDEKLKKYNLQEHIITYI